MNWSERLRASAESTWLGRTGQRWKLLISFLLMQPFFWNVIGGFAGWWDPLVDFAVFSSLFVIATLGAGVWFFWIRCPNCKTAAAWKLANTRNVGLQDELWVRQSCPACDDPCIPEHIQKKREEFIRGAADELQ